jgi:hypothetical protein
MPTRRRPYRRLAGSRPAAFRGVIESLEQRFALAVTYHGGSLLTHVALQGVYIGSSSATSSSNWTSNSTLAGQKTQLDGFLSYIVNSPYMDMLDAAGYNNPSNVASPPSFRGTADAGVVANTLTSTTLSDAQVQSIVQAQITSGAAKAPGANRLYVVYVAGGITVTMGGSSSVNSFLGYHGAFAGRTATGAAADVRYAVMPYPGSPNPTPSSQGFASILDEETAVSTHEIAEAVTDPDVNYKSLGWYDDTLNGEIGDLTSDTATLNGYLVQKVVGKNDMVIGPSTTPTPPPTATPSPVVNSLTISPTSITVGATTAVVLTANATDSTAATITGVKFYASSGTLLGSGVASGSNWSLTIAGTSSLAVGNYSYYAVATDSAGVSTPAGTSATSVVLAVNAPAPVNDSFANASVVAGRSFNVTGTNVNATKQAGEPSVAGNAGGKSVWWTWTAPSSGSVTLKTAGSSFDTLLGVYTGASVSGLKLVASNDDAGGAATSAVTFNAVAGTAYRFVVDGYNAASGSISLGLTMTTTTAPANDTFANASVVTGTSFSAIGTNVNATKQSGEPTVAGNAGGKSVWWNWTAPSSGSVSLTTVGSSFDTLLGVYTGASVSGLTLVASNDDAGGVVTSAVTFNAVAGTTYRFAVDGYNAASGSISLGLTMTTAAAVASSPTKGEGSLQHDRRTVGSPSGCPKSEAFAALAQTASSGTRPQARPFLFR